MPENQNIEYKSSWHDEYLKWVCGFMVALFKTAQVIDEGGAIGGEMGGAIGGSLVKIREDLGAIEDRIKEGKEINIQYLSSVFDVFSEYFNVDFRITSEKLHEKFGMPSGKLQESFRKAPAKLVFNIAIDSSLPEYCCGKHLENNQDFRKNYLQVF